MQDTRFVLKSPFRPQGDQPQAIEALTRGAEAGMPCQVLMGVTGSGKTYTMASVIERLQRPTLVIAHNKTLAAQLYGELKAFFPDNAVEYFVSYYDYYQPEAYIPQTDTYIAKDSAINDEIERFRLSAANALVQRRDVVVVASVSCIYGHRLPEGLRGHDGLPRPRHGDRPRRAADAPHRDPVRAQRLRLEARLLPRPRATRWTSSPRGNDQGRLPRRVLRRRDRAHSASSTPSPATSRRSATSPSSPRRNYAPAGEVEKRPRGHRARPGDPRARRFRSEPKLLEAQRLQQRTEYDLAMIREIGYCTGIENYPGRSRTAATGRRPSSR